MVKDGGKPLVAEALEGHLTVTRQYQYTISHHPAGGLTPLLYHHQADTGSVVLEAVSTGGAHCRKNTKLQVQKEA